MAYQAVTLANAKVQVTLTCNFQTCHPKSNAKCVYIKSFKSKASRHPNKPILIPPLQKPPLPF